MYLKYILAFYPLLFQQFAKLIIRGGAQWTKNKVLSTLINEIKKNVQIFEQNIVKTVILRPLINSDIFGFSLC